MATSIRNIVRPKAIKTTPSLLKEAINARRTRAYPTERTHIPLDFYDWSRDLFLVYPPANLVKGADNVYQELYKFFSGNKPTQRRILEQLGIPTIPCITRKADAESLKAKRFTDDSTYIVRPLRHSGGRDYKVTTSPEDFSEGAEYCSVLFPKRREFRVIFFRGSPIITLRKSVPEGTAYEAPWNHATGSSFVTVEREENNHLLKTTCMEDLAKCPLVQHAHFIGVDILLSRKSKSYVVVEINSAPALTLEHNLEKVKELVSSTN